MIKANEIRLGNCFEIEGEIKRIDSDGMWSIYERNHGKSIEEELSNEIDWIKPIPLTPELLQKAGFVSNGSKYFLDLGEDLYLNFYCDGLDFTFGTDSNLSAFGPTDIIYLHQLQNLFYSLTGEEIELHL